MFESEKGCRLQLAPPSWVEIEPPWPTARQSWESAQAIDDKGGVLAGGVTVTQIEPPSELVEISPDPSAPTPTEMHSVTEGHATEVATGPEE